MTADVRWCTIEDSAQKAAQVMKEADTGVVPIIDNDQERRVVGIVTDRDLVCGIVADAKDSRQIKVGKLASDEIVACRTEDEAQDAADNMAVYQVRRLPVLDDNDRLVGIDRRVILTPAPMLDRQLLKSNFTMSVYGSRHG
jgi:CBS domain-containing protein